ncbi:MAG TPA: endonuclease domain-containing protein [Rhodoblastus sp.]|nr:endonuclease domain-containing protein [Rhodoblastus sp.]
MTATEAILWRDLRGGALNGLKFRRQVPIGRYVVDFLCVEHRLIVELDGAPHESIEQKLHDAARDGELRRRGYRILRFANDAVLTGGNLVLDQIRRAISANARAQSREPSSDPR